MCNYARNQNLQMQREGLMVRFRASSEQHFAGIITALSWAKGSSENMFEKPCVRVCAQSCETLRDPMDCSSPGSSVHGILQARILEWGAISFSNAWKWKVKVKSLNCVRPSVTTWTAAFQVPPSLGFSRQEYLSEVPLPSPCHPANGTYMQTTSCEMPGWMKHKLESRLPGEI